MKKKLLFGLLLFGAATANGQGYTFSVSQETYTDLIFPNSLSNDSTWDDPTYNVPIGFSFSVYNDVMTNLVINGDVGLGALISSPNYNSSPTSLLFANGADIIDRGFDFNIGASPSGGVSDISYLLEGPAGNQILKIEWKNVGFYSDIDDDGISTDFTNFQLWLYESSGNIEIHFGPTSVSQPFICYDGQTGPFFGIYASFDAVNFANLSSALELTGNANSPTAQASVNPYTTFTNGTVTDGRVYRFTRTVLNLDEKVLTDETWSISPNPSNGNVHIQFSEEMPLETKIILTNQLGQELKSIENFGDNSMDLDLSEYKAGIYFVTAVFNNGCLKRRVIKN